MNNLPNARYKFYVQCSGLFDIIMSNIDITKNQIFLKDTKEKSNKLINLIIFYLYDLPSSSDESEVTYATLNLSGSTSPPSSTKTSFSDKFFKVILGKLVICYLSDMEIQQLTLKDPSDVLKTEYDNYINNTTKNFLDKIILFNRFIDVYTERYTDIQDKLNKILGDGYGSSVISPVGGVGDGEYGAGEYGGGVSSAGGDGAGAGGGDDDSGGGASGDGGKTIGNRACRPHQSSESDVLSGFPILKSQFCCFPMQNEQQSRRHVHEAPRGTPFVCDCCQF